MSAHGNDIEITLNGTSRCCAPGTTVAQLVAQLAVRGRYAVEINGAIVPRSTHPTHVIAVGDRIEVVAAIGGG
jgi:sulfur carrier protein